MMNNLIWHGPFCGQSGYEVITRELLLALDKIGVKIRLQPASGWNREMIQLPLDVQSRFKRMIHNKVPEGTPCIMHQKDQEAILKLITPETKKYCYTLFETNKLPKPWIDGLKKMEKVFTFSNFNKNCWKELDNVHVLPYGVSKEFKEDMSAANILNKKGYTFLCNGDFVERKNFEGLMKAYVEEFDSSDDVTLILKTHFGGFTKRNQEALKDDIQRYVNDLGKTNPPKILIFLDKIQVEDMVALYKACDCFVLPSKGEGLGLPILEAMACGKPIIATDWSALSELPFEGIRIPATEEVIDNIEFIKKCPHALNHKWAKIDNKDIRKALREAFTNQEEYKTMGEHNAKIAKDLHWHNAALEMMRVIGGAECTS